MEEPTTEEQWRAKLTDEQFEVLRNKGTERAYTGALLEEHRKGMFECAACGAELFSSGAKFESGTGWPSFTEPANLENVELVEDRSYDMIRTEVLCKNCGGHLGHVFPDGPGPKGERYCINSVSLGFREADASTEPASTRRDPGG